MSDTVLSKSPNFMDLGMSSVDTTDELGSVFSPTNIIDLLTHGSDRPMCGHHISGATTDRVSGTRPKHNYNLKSDF